MRTNYEEVPVLKGVHGIKKIFKKAALKFLGLFRSKYNTNRSTGTHIYFIIIANSSETFFLFFKENKTEA